ncbi:MAG: hypothetical protein IJ848_02730 [Alphaproteobacteria bacterium]|nr:hypothetical protein [Alphaproteobacteria bacterium]
MDKCLEKRREFTIEFGNDEYINPNIKKEFHGKEAVVHTKLSKDASEILGMSCNIKDLPCFIFNNTCMDVVFLDGHIPTREYNESTKEGKNNTIAKCLNISIGKLNTLYN